jgi:phosphoesterase RecJ-like protein
MKVLPQFKTAYIYLSMVDQNRYDYQIGDSEGIVNYALSIEGIRFAAFFTEKKDKVRTSFRSKGDFSVNEFARKYFDGGGHRNAAGGNSYTTLIKTRRYFEKLLSDINI